MAASPACQPHCQLACQWREVRMPGCEKIWVVWEVPGWLQCCGEKKKKKLIQEKKPPNLPKIRFQFWLWTRVSFCFTTTRCAAKIACTSAPLPARRRTCCSFPPTFHLMFWQNSVISYQLTLRLADVEENFEIQLNYICAQVLAVVFTVHFCSNSFIWDQLATAF